MSSCYPASQSVGVGVGDGGSGSQGLWHGVWIKGLELKQTCTKLVTGVLELFDCLIRSKTRPWQILLDLAKLHHGSLHTRYFR